MILFINQKEDVLDMDKKQLNQEIVLCRAEVKRARVCVIRKLVRQIKKLRNCKNEKLKEKKLRRAKRLAAEMHMMKTLKPDYVTKFALTTENYVSTGSNTKLKRKRNACAKLSKHKHIAERIDKIRSKFNNWREEIPPLLVKVSKRRKADARDANPDGDDENDENKTVKVTKKMGKKKDVISSEEEDSNGGSGEEDVDFEEGDDGDANDNEGEHEEEEDSGDDDMEIKRPVLKQKPKMNESNNWNVKVREPMVKKEQNVGKKKRGKMNDSEEREFDDVRPMKGKKNKKKEKQTEGENEEKVVQEKVDDPFFIGKKVIVPKLLQTGSEETHTDNVKERKRKLSADFEEEFKVKSKPNPKIPQRKAPPEREYKRLGEPLSEEELHPSWRAKKVQMIKPFEGKKIKFE